jgi:GAF domain-containing protein
MTSSAADPVLQAVLGSALQTTGAMVGFLLRPNGDDLTVVATAGYGVDHLRGSVVPGEGGVAAYVLASGQPLALTVRPGDPRRQEGVLALLDQAPSAVLGVPCSTDEDAVGALLLLDKPAGQFTFDDVELATLLAGIAGVAMAQAGPGGVQVPDPAELAGDLERLARSDPSRYGMVATIVQALLARG